MEKVAFGIGAAVIIGLIATVLSFIWAFPVAWLWNAAMPQIFHGLSTINYWQAWALSLLCQILFLPRYSSTINSSN